MDRLDAAYKKARLVGEGGAGRLRIAFVGSASHGVLPNLIKSCRTPYPNAELAYSAMNTAALHSALVQREIDLAVARPALSDDELRAEALVHEDLILAVPDSSEVASRKVIRLADLNKKNGCPLSSPTAPLLRGLGPRHLPRGRFQTCGIGTGAG
ncbi:LysR family substrate-binding domain-containing protein [Mesobacterium pallidum]|uniref:LysR family substrate-binding domain-containing protein n=1 Tax=Mesobacterium pallidum TaxID=2872037 RepID=UPI001EE1AE36